VSLDFRTKKPPQADGGEPLLKGSLPLPQAMASRTPDFKNARMLTPMEREELEKAGLNLADPIPGNVADLMAEARQEHADIRQAVASQVEINRMASQEFIPTGAGVAQAREVGIQAAMKRAMAHDPLTQGATAPTKGASFKTPEPTPVVATPRGVDPEPPPNPDHDHKPGAPCPRCLHNPAQKIAEPDKNDIILYLPVLRGGRFRKTYDRFGGRVQISFRSLSTTEWDMVQAQLVRDIARGVISNEFAYGERLYDYRMVVSIESVFTDGGVPAQIPPVGEIPWEADETDRPDEANAVGALWKYLRTHVLTSETLMRTCSTTFAEFVKLRETLDLRAASPDFWQGIGS